MVDVVVLFLVTGGKPCYLGGMRKEHGCTSAEVLVDPGDKQDVYVLHRFPSLEQAQAFAGSSELREAMSRAGVKGAPRIEIAVGT